MGLFASVEVGLIAGTLTHLCMLMYRASSPNMRSELVRWSNDQGYHLVEPDQALFFPAVDEIRARLGEIAAADPRPIVVDMNRVVDMDYTAAKVS